MSETKINMTKQIDQMNVDKDSVISTLSDILGVDHVITDADELAYYSQDAFWEGVRAFAVIQPRSKQQLADAVAAATSAGCPVTARGGGMSYTRGYIPAEPNTVIVDCSHLDRIIAINEDDMYVTVEAGCTWMQLYEALAEKGLRTPYYGPMSGMFATIGGTLSQNSLFYGSGTYGTAAESVLAVEVVTADGQSIRTGSSANRAGEPFYRYYGPDLTGLFLADAGALGFKVEATLRIIPAPKATEYASFAFDNFYDMVDAQVLIGHEQLAAECFGLDPYLNGARAMVKDLKTGAKTLSDVAKSGSTLLKGVKDAVAVAKAGTGFLENIQYSLHITIDAAYEQDAVWKRDRVHAICTQKGWEMESTIPRVTRATPFRHVGEFLTGSNGERWIPIHAGVPATRIKKLFDATMGYFESKADILKEFNINTSHLSSNCGYDLSFEPAFYFPDKINIFQQRHLEPKDAEAYAKNPAVPGATAAVQGMLNDMAQLFMEQGAVNRQLGKFYPFQEAIAPESYALIQGMKTLVDPKGLINPGALGLQ